MTKKLKTVMIGTSLTPMSDAVVGAGLQVARAAGAKVVLVHAFQPRMTHGGDAYVAEVALVEALEAEKLLIERRLEEQIERLGLRGELAGKRVECGPSHRVLTETAEALGADLLVVGSTESEGLAKMFGSTADRVIRKSLRPVLVVRGPLAVPPRKVLLPVDFSPLSAVAFRRGLAVVDQIARDSDVRLEALHVRADSDRGLFELSDPELSEPEAIRELDRFVAQNTFASRRSVMIHVVRGEVQAAIRARSEEWGADLVVLGTHGRGGFERFLLGSVAADVVRRGATSVLVIPPVVEVEVAKPLRSRAVVALQATA